MNDPELKQINAQMRKNFEDLSNIDMPFGKYKGRKLINLPEPYLVWFSQKGFPEGRLGMLLRSLYEIKTNGLEYLFEEHKKAGYKKLSKD